jgi:RNA polymerase sigma-70 factor (ECF subfamily)
MTVDEKSDSQSQSDADASDAPVSDGTLLRRFRTGSSDAATALYIRYANRLQRLADAKTSRKLDVAVDTEGIVQSVFRTFFRRVERGQYDVDDSDSLWRLLLVIAMNKIRSRAVFLSAGKRDQNRNVSIEATGMSPNTSDGRDAEAYRILQMTIDELLGKFPEDVREIIRLRIDGHQVSEIAEKTQRAKRSVERVLQNFRQTLNESLEAD